MFSALTPDAFALPQEHKETLEGTAVTRDYKTLYGEKSLQGFSKEQKIQYRGILLMDSIQAWGIAYSEESKEMTNNIGTCTNTLFDPTLIAKQTPEFHKQLREYLENIYFTLYDVNIPLTIKKKYFSLLAKAVEKINASVLDRVKEILHKLTQEILYFSLYGDKPIEKQYIRAANCKTEAQKKQREQFENQFFALIDALKNWGAENNASAETLEKILDCKKKIFHPDYASTQGLEFFAIIKQNLESILFLLKDKNFNLKKKLTNYESLSGALQAGICDAGMYTRIEETLNMMTSGVDVSIERWLAEFRTNIIDEYTENFFSAHLSSPRFTEGNYVHIENVFLRKAYELGFAPLSKLDQINDRYISAKDIGIEEKETAEFKKTFENLYTPTSIMNIITNRFVSKIDECKKTYAIHEEKDEKGWIATTTSAFKDFNKQLTLISKNIGLDEINFFEFNDDGTKMRFCPDFFKAAFLKHCRDQNFLFKKETWGELTLASGYKFHYLVPNFFSIAWCENADKEFLNWQKIPEDVDAGMILGSLLIRVQLDMWPTIIANTVVNLKSAIKNTTHFTSLLAQFVEEPLLQAIIRELTIDYIKSTLIKPSDLVRFSESLPKEDKWKFSIIRDFYQADLNQTLKDAITRDDAREVKQLLSEFKLSPDHKLENDASLLIYAAEYNKVNVIEMLCESKADTEAREKQDGNTAVHYAAYYNQHAALLKLIQYRAFLGAKNNAGITPAHFAVNKNQINIIKEFAKLGVNFNVPNNDNKSAFTWALENENWDILAIMLKVDPACITGPYPSPMHNAAAKGDLATMQYLVKYGFDINAGDTEGNTPVFIAIKHQGVDFLYALLTCKDFTIHLNAMNHNSETPALYAMKLRHSSIIKLFAENPVVKFNFMQGITTPIQDTHLQHNWDTVNLILMSINDDNILAPSAMSFLMPHREQLTTHFINYVSRLPDQAQQKQLVDSILYKGNALSRILFTPSGATGTFVNFFRERTSKIQRIADAFANLKEFKEVKPRISDSLNRYEEKFEYKY